MTKRNGNLVLWKISNYYQELTMKKQKNCLFIKLHRYVRLMLGKLIRLIIIIYRSRKLVCKVLGREMLFFLNISLLVLLSFLLDVFVTLINININIIVKMKEKPYIVAYLDMHALVFHISSLIS